MPAADFQHLHRQVRRAADADRSIGELVGIRLGIGCKPGQRCGRHLGMDDQHIGRGRDHRDDRKRRGVVIDLGVEALVDDQRARPGREQGVAVGRRLEDEFGAEIAAGAGTMLDDHRLAPARRERLAQQPRDQIRGAARARGHHDADRTDGIVGLGDHGGGGCQEHHRRSSDRRERQPQGTGSAYRHHATLPSPRRQPQRRRSVGGRSSADLDRQPCHPVALGDKEGPRQVRFGRLAQLVERLLYTQDVGGSSPSPPTT